MTLKSMRDAVNLLNDALENDRDTIQKLFMYKSRCNQSIVNHPTIQVTDSGEVGLLSILNGIFADDVRVAALTDGKFAAIAAVLDDDGNLIKFDVVQAQLTHPSADANHFPDKANTS